MARSYASVVRGPAPTEAPEPKASVLRVEAPVWTPPPRCYYCGAAADVCPRCRETCSYYPAHGLQPVVQDGRCSEHARYHESKDHAFFNCDMAKYIPQTCGACREVKPWKPSDCLELKGFSYERMCLCHPLKSPNGGRFNVVFVGQRRYIPVGQPKSSEEQVAAWAQAAYDKELEFSGDTNRAEVMKAAVLCGDPLVDITYRLYEAGAD